MSMIVPGSAYNGGSERGLPVVVNTVVATSNGSNTTSHAVTIPAGVQAGDLLMVFIAADRHPVISGFSGWTLLHQYDGADAAECGTQVWYKIANGTETTFNVTTNASRKVGSFTFQIRNYDPTTPPEKTSTGNVSTNQPDAPSISPSWGDSKFLAIAFFGHDTDDNLTSYPSNCPDNRAWTLTGGGTGACTTGVASANVVGSSFNPSVFTLAAVDQTNTVTVAIQGAS